MQNKLFELDLYIEELQEELKQVREERNQFLQELRTSEAHGLRLMQRASQHRVCNSGSVRSAPFVQRQGNTPTASGV